MTLPIAVTVYPDSTGTSRLAEPSGDSRPSAA
jgi:hypothetical protein